MDTPKIIFENEDFMVLDKPPGWVVNDAKTVKSTYVIQNWLKKLKYPLSNSFDKRSGIVHRLDKDTSGILLVAKNISTFEKLQVLFKERAIKKSYLALVHGEVFPLQGTIQNTVGRLPWNRERFGVLPGGREARTDYKVLDVYYLKTKKEDLFSMVAIYPKTGRTHQIRIHFKSIRHPVVADIFYAGRKASRNDRKWCPRLFLHAQSIEFSLENTPFKFNSELPTDLKKSLEFLVKKNR